MKLETAQFLGSAHATIDDIRNAIADDKGRGEYIILSSSPQHYIQAGGESEPFVLEHRDGSACEHYQCKKDVSKKDLEIALVSYLSGDSIWKTQFDWKRAEQKPWWKLW